MPEWGFTEGRRALDETPWGLPELVLAPGKVYTDPVHGDVYLTVLEQWLVDTPPFQRLRRVRQLGTTHLVYPGATHTRFSHSLGAVRVVQNLLDAVISQRDGLHPVDDRFAQWEEEGLEVLSRHVGRATVLARLGALLHDLCHVPLGHSVEDDLRVLVEHDKNNKRFSDLWAAVEAAVHHRIDGLAVDENGRSALQEGLRTLFEAKGELHQELKPLIISKGRGVKAHKDMQYPFAADLVGNTICADLLDYLLRDHLFTGLPASLGHRFLSGFFVVPRGHGLYSERLALNIMRSGHERADVVSELLKTLRYRYELSERALVHHAKLSADAMVGKALEYWSQALWLEQAANTIADVDDHQQRLDADDVLGLRRRVRKNLSQGDFNALDRAVAERLELEFRWHGDDGLFERMLTLPDDLPAEAHVRDTAARLFQRAAGFAGRILTRDLYAVGGRASAANAPADELVKRYGNAEARSRLEREVAEFAELEHASRVLLWLPGREMRLKLAYVLVHDGATVKPFVEYERAGRQRGSDIYDAHRDLWAVWVFLDRTVSEDQAQTVLSFLASRLGVRWERMDDFGPQPANWLTKLAISQVKGLKLPSREVDELVKELPDFAARGAKTYTDFVAAVEQALP